MARGKGPTYSELSNMTGISVATISRVMNRSSLVTDKTREKVLSALKSSGVDTSEYEMRDTFSNLIVFNVPSLRNIFYSPVISSARIRIEEKGYTLFINEDTVNDDNIDSFIARMKRVGAKGLVLANPLSVDALERLSHEFHIVTCCETVPSSEFPFVNIDDRGGAYKAVRHLLSIGRRRIAMINGPEEFKYARERRAGYEEALREYGIDVDESYVACVGEDMDYDTAKRHAERLLNLADPPDAFFCISDILASAAENAAVKKKLDVPSDVAIVGFDDTMVSHIANPAISTIRQPVERIGSSVADLIIGLIEGKERINRSVLLDTELVIRESSAV